MPSRKTRMIFIIIVLLAGFAYFAYPYLSRRVLPAESEQSVTSSSRIVRHIEDAGFNFDVSPDGQHLVSDDSGKLSFWNLGSGFLEFQIPERVLVLDVEWSPNAAFVAFMHEDIDSDDTFIRIWEYAREATKIELVVEQNIHDIAWSPDSLYLAGLTADSLFLWDGSSFNILDHVGIPISASRQLSWSPDSLSFAISVDDKLAIYTIHDNRLVAIRAIPTIGNTQVVAWSPDGETLLAGDFYGNILIVDLNTGEVLNTIAAHSDWISSLAWSSTGEYFVSTSDDRNAIVWNFETGEAIYTLSHRIGVADAVWINNDQYLLTSAFGVFVWDLPLE